MRELVETQRNLLSPTFAGRFTQVFVVGCMRGWE